MFVGFALVVLIAVTFLLYKVTPVASCTDGKLNQNETRVDCGGECGACLVDTAKDLIVLWTRYFPVRAGEYEVATLVENPNTGVGIRSLPYSYRLLDENGDTIMVRRGQTFATPSSRFLIFETGILTGNRTVSKVSFDLQEFSWEVVKAENLPLGIVKTTRMFSQARPQLAVTIGNNSIRDVEHINLQVVLLDSSGNAVGVDSSLDIKIPDSQTKETVFTWPRPFAAEVATVNVYYRRNPW
jgi:hypothetical protein